MISKNIDLIALGALLLAMAAFSQTRRVVLAPAAPVRIQMPQAPSCPVVIPNLPKIVVSI